MQESYKLYNRSDTVLNAKNKFLKNLVPINEMEEEIESDEEFDREEDAPKWINPST